LDIFPKSDSTALFKSTPAASTTDVSFSITFCFLPQYGQVPHNILIFLLQAEHSAVSFSEQLGQYVKSRLME